MKKIIIFDFYRTLYNPESSQLVHGVRGLLKYLKKKGCALYILTRKEGKRDALINELDITQYVIDVILVENKTKKAFVDISGKHKDIKMHDIYVVGDRVREEIALGNECGMTTIWFHNGKFAHEVPRYPRECPTHTITALQDVIRVVAEE